MNSVYFWVSVLAAGVSLYALVWVVMQPAAITIEAHPGTTRHKRAVLLALLWPWVLVMKPVIEPFVSWRTRQLLQRMLAVAGLDEGGWQPGHVFSLQALIFLLSLIFVAGLLFTYTGLTLLHAVSAGLLCGVVLMWWPWLWLRDLRRQRQLIMLREFPFLLDMTTLCVEAGLNLQGALQQAAAHGPDGPLRAELRRSLNDMRAGVPRLQALSLLAIRTGLPAVRSLVTALTQADQLGMSLAPLLRSQSDQRRNERFLRAEKLALEAPVKMLFPMVCCIFPCTFLILGFPIVIKLMNSGL